jgi:hypothetical protein
MTIKKSVRRAPRKPAEIKTQASAIDKAIDLIKWVDTPFKLFGVVVLTILFGFGYFAWDSRQVILNAITSHEKLPQLKDVVERGWNRNIGYHAAILRGVSVGKVKLLNGKFYCTCLRLSFLPALFQKSTQLYHSLHSTLAVSAFFTDHERSAIVLKRPCSNFGSGGASTASENEKRALV